MVTKTPARSVDCQDCVIQATCTLNRIRHEERIRIEPKVRERIFHRGDVLLEEGQIAKSARFVKLGTVFGYRRGLDGWSRPIGVAIRGSALGIVGTFDMPSQATCIAQTTVRVCEVPVIDLREASTCGSSLAEEVARSITQIFAALTTWSEAMRLPGTINQLAYILVLLADANKASSVQLPSHSALAELLGTRRETISRALRALESEGGISRHDRKRCEVHRYKLLTRLHAGKQ